MDEKIIEDIKDEEDTALEVTVKKEKTPPEPSFDYDDYTPSDTEILEIEKEITEKIEKRTAKHGT